MHVVAYNLEATGNVQSLTLPDWCLATSFIEIRKIAKDGKRTGVPHLSRGPALRITEYVLLLPIKDQPRLVLLAQL